MSMKAIRDLYTITNTLPPVAKSASFSSAAIDLANAEENVIVIEPGLWTDGTHTFKLQDSADNTTYADNTTDIVGSFAVESSTATAIVQKVSYIGAARYVRIVDTVTAGTTGAILGILAITKPRKQAAA